MWDPYAEFQSTTLPNGLQIHAAHWPNRPWEAMGFLVHSGAEQDPVGLEGLAHFVEHVVSDNSGSSKTDLHKFFENFGGICDLGGTGHAYTMYRFFAPAEPSVLIQAFELFGLMLLQAKITEFVERERKVIIGEFNKLYPFQFLFDLDIRENRALYKGYWLERFTRPLGNPESIRRITQADLQAYYDQHYTPANISIVGVGGLRLDQIAEMVSRSPFSISKAGKRSALPQPVTIVSAPTERGYDCNISDYVKEQVLAAKYRSVTRIPGTAREQAVRLLRSMLAEKLNEEVREKRAWTYHIGVTYCDLRHFYELAIDCGSLSPQALETIEEVVNETIVSLRHCQDLFDRFKHSAIAGNFMTDPNGKGVCDGAMEDLYNFGRIISLQEIGDEIEQVQMSDIRHLLQWLAPEWRWTAIGRP